MTARAKRGAAANRKSRGRWQPPYWPKDGDYGTSSDRSVRFNVVVAGCLDGIMCSVAAQNISQARYYLGCLSRVIAEADLPPNGHGAWVGVLHGAKPKELLWRGSHRIVAPDNVVSLDAVRRQRRGESDA